MDNRGGLINSNYSDSNLSETGKNALLNLMTVYIKLFDRHIDETVYQDNYLVTFKFDAGDMTFSKLHSFNGLIINPENLIEGRSSQYVHIMAMKLFKDIINFSPCNKMSYNRYENLVKKFAFIEGVYKLFSEVFKMTPNSYAIKYKGFLVYRKQKCTELTQLCSKDPKLIGEYRSYQGILNFNEPTLYGKFGEVKTIVLLLCGLPTIYDKQGIKQRMRGIARQCLKHKLIIPYIKKTFIYTDDKMLSEDFKELLETSFVIEGLLK
jgi:hypothetical protein